MIPFGRNHGNVFDFLGFTFFWSKGYTSSGYKLAVKTSKKTLFKKIEDYQTWIKENRGRKKLDALWKITATKLKGHYNYYGLVTNRPKMNHFYHAVIWSLFKWLNRRSQRKSFTWERFSKRLRFNPLPMPPIIKALVKLDLGRCYAY